MEKYTNSYFAILKLNFIEHYLLMKFFDIIDCLQGTYFDNSSKMSSTGLPIQPNSRHFSRSGTQTQSNLPTLARNTRILCLMNRLESWYCKKYFFFVILFFAKLFLINFGIDLLGPQLGPDLCILDHRDIFLPQSNNW